MATVHVNRELLQGVVDLLQDYHEPVKEICCSRGMCVTQQRLDRIIGAIKRTPTDQEG